MTQLKLAFVLRIWEERALLETGESELRGSLHRVDTDDIRYFIDLKQIEVILQQWIERRREEKTLSSRPVSGLIERSGRQ